jgi:hypothetical protein
MKTPWNAKNLIIGMLIGAGAVAIIGATTAPIHTTTPVGRFQIASGAIGAYVVDTATGQVWSAANADFQPQKIQ